MLRFYGEVETYRARIGAIDGYLKRNRVDARLRVLVAPIQLTPLPRGPLQTSEPIYQGMLQPLGDCPVLAGEATL